MNNQTDHTESMREELTTMILEAIRTNENDYTYDYIVLVSDTLLKCTIPQLWRVYRMLVVAGQPMKLLPCDPKQYLATTIGQTFVGIETDGHAHS